MFDIAAQLEAIVPVGLTGSVVRTLGMTAAVADFPAPIGAVALIERQTGAPVAAEVIGFRDELTQLYLYEETHGIRRGNRVRLVRTARWIKVGPGLLGRVVNAHGACVDGRPQPSLVDRVPLDRAPPPAVERPRISQPFATGVRALDGMLACGRGQRMGIFAGSGVGKSTLLGMMARYATADVNVIALVGERGREVNEFIERDLGPGGLARSVVVVATSDEPALVRLQAALAATAIAEYFRDQRKDVLLLMDSRWRSARSAWRQASRRPRADSLPACSPCCPDCSNAPAAAPQEASRRSIPCWSKATTLTSRSATRCAGCSMGTPG